MSDFSDVAQFIFKQHYQARNMKGEHIEQSPEDVFNRVSGAYEKAGIPEEQTTTLKELHTKRLFSFNSPVYYNLGLTDKPVLAACYVTSLEDDMTSITEAWAKSVLVFKAGAGIGIPAWKLRPAGASLGDGGAHKAGSTGSSGGPSFMKMFNVAGEVVRSAGKRRAAMLCAMTCWHPDVLEFIAIKSGPERSKLEMMNLSVLCTDEFMQKVEDQADWNLQWKDTVWHKMKADTLLRMVAENAWKMGDPGVLFIDRINEDNLAPSLGAIECPNPCGEEPLHPGGVCNLGAINLYQLTKANALQKAFMEADGGPGTLPKLSLECILEEVHTVVLQVMPFLDANIDVTHYPHGDFEENSKFVRNVGLGISGFGEMLAYLCIPYASESARTLGRAIMEELTLSAWEWGIVKAGKAKEEAQAQSKEAECVSIMAGQKHPDAVDDVDDTSPFYGAAPCFTEEQNRNAYIEFLNRRYEKATYGEDPPQRQRERWANLIKAARGGKFPRNSNVTTIAPVGSTGLAFDTWTGGGEPIFALAYRRSVLTEDGKKTIVMNDPEFQAALDRLGVDIPPSEVKAAEGRVGKLPVPRHMKEVFATAHEIPWEDRVKMQAALQTFCTAAISSTVNLPKEATVEDVLGIYKLAHELGCKGITVFRDGCDVEGILTTGKQRLKDYERPLVLQGRTLKAKLHSVMETHNVYVTINEDEGEVVEVFINVGNSGADVAANAQVMGRLLSGGLQEGGTVERLTKRLIGIKSEKLGMITLAEGDKPVKVESVADLVGKLLRRHYMDRKEVKQSSTGQLCPECKHHTLEHGIDPGCLVCTNCGKAVCGG